MSISQNFPEEGPTLNLNFAGSKTLDPRITFSRTTTGTYMDANGLIVTAPADAPRFDHRYVNGEIESLGLLVEESRSNLITYSDTLVTGWNHIGFTSNAVDSTYPNPTGNLGTKKLVEETGNSGNQKVLYKDITVGINTTSNDQVFSHSIFVKPIGDRNAQINIHNAASGSGSKGFTVNFNLSGLTAFTTSASASSSLDDYGVVPYPNGWYKIYVVGNTGSLNSDGTTLRFHLRILNSSGNQIYTGNGSSGLYAYGAQMELGSFPTSYIPTQSSTATRTVDQASITGSNFSSWFNNNEFSIFTHHKFPSVPPNYYPRVFDINTGNDAYRMNHYHDPSFNGTRVGCSVVENDSVQYVQVTSSYDIGDDLRMASCFKDNDFASYANGTLIGSTDDTGVFTTTQRTVLYIGSTANGGSPLNGAISQLTYYPRRLTNTQLQNLTK